MSILPDSDPTVTETSGIIAPQALRTDEAEVIEVVEETARIAVERRETGRVRVSVQTRSVDEQHPVDLASQSVTVTRHPVDREIDTIPEPREDGDLLIVPVVEERAVVVTKLFLTEEIHIRRTRTTQSVAVPVTLRRQHAVVEQLEPGSADLGPGQPG